jgi:hypothetical protein
MAKELKRGLVGFVDLVFKLKDVVRSSLLLSLEDTLLLVKLAGASSLGSELDFNILSLGKRGLEFKD